MKDAIQQFRITTWPGPVRVAPREEPLGGGHYHLVDDVVMAADVGLAHLMLYIDEEAGIEGDALVRVVGRPEAQVELAPGMRPAAEVVAVGEVYLELSAVDLDDPDAILSFVRRFGPLGVAHEAFGLFRSLPWFASIVRRLARVWPYASETTYRNERGASKWAREVETLDEFRFGARCIRDCMRAWEIVRGADDVGPVDWESVPRRALRAERERMWSMGIETDARFEATEYMLGHMLGGGLIPFHPAVIETSEGDTYAGPAAWRIPLYSHCCLELFNHIAENASYRLCANTPCGRMFVRQTGRAEQGQFHSRGVKYCSMHCARAQAQRMHRLRKQADRSS